MSAYEQEFKQLKNQDITIRRLEDQIADFKSRIEDKVAEEVSKRIVDLEGAFIVTFLYSCQHSSMSAGTIMHIFMPIRIDCNMYT